MRQPHNFLGFSLSVEQTTRAHVPHKLSERAALARVCASLHVQHAHNRSDPWAYARAYSRVMNGLLSHADFESGGISL